MSENSTHLLHMHTFPITHTLPLTAEGVTSIPLECWFLTCGRWWGSCFMCTHAASYTPVTHMPCESATPAQLCTPAMQVSPSCALRCQPSSWSVALFMLLTYFFSS